MSSTRERRVQCYPSPLYYNLFRAYIDIEKISESQAGAHAIKRLIDTLPLDQKKMVERVAKEKYSKNTY